MPRLGMREAQDLAAAAFTGAGVPEAAATAAAEVLTLAEAMGIRGHGLIRVGDYLGRIAAGGIVPDALPKLEAAAPALVRIDGRHGLGPATAHMAMSAAMEAARATGIGAAFCRNAAHLGALAPYLWIAAEAGFVMLMTTNTAPMISPAGGTGARIGNSPLGLGIPHPDGAHLLLDISMTVVARSRIRAAARAGEMIPDAWACDADGRPTRDPNAALAGILRAVGGDKGANLALSLDLFASVLGGAAMLSEIPAGADDPAARQGLGYAVIAIDARALASDEVRRDRLGVASEIVGATPPGDGTTRPRLPGERAIAALEDARQNGIEISGQVARDLGVAPD